MNALLPCVKHAYCLCVLKEPPFLVLGGFLSAFAGVQLLPESYAALIFSYMELNPPDVTVAKTLYSAMAGTDTDQQLPWSVLCRLLSAKDFATDTIAVVREGLVRGLEMDSDVAEAYIKALCSTQQSVSQRTWWC